MKVIFNIRCPHCGYTLVIPQNHAKEITPSVVVVTGTCGQCQNLFVAINNKVRALEPSIVQSGDPTKIRDHFIDRFSDLGAEMLESLKTLDVFKKTGRNSTNIISATDAKQFPKYEPPELGPGEITDPSNKGTGSMHQPMDRPQRPITQKEINRFREIEVKLIDDKTYFKKHLG